LTYKVNGRTVSESFATPAEQYKAEREIETLRRYRQLERSFVEVNEKICRARPAESAYSGGKSGRSDPNRDRARSNHGFGSHLRRAEANRQYGSGGGGDGLLFRRASG
jgi:hypothetical protein